MSVRWFVVAAACVFAVGWIAGATSRVDSAENSSLPKERGEGESNSKGSRWGPLAKVGEVEGEHRVALAGELAGGDRPELLLLLLSEWALDEPGAALAFAGELPNDLRPEARSAVFEVWARAAPDDLLTFVQEMTDRDLRQWDWKAALAGAVEVAFSQSPSAAMRIAKTEDGEWRSGAMAEALFAEWVARDTRGAVEEAGELLKSSLRNFVFKQAALKTYRDAGAPAAFRWALELDGTPDEQRRARIAIAGEWAEQEPLVALAAIRDGEIEDADLRDHIVTELVNACSEKLTFEDMRELVSMTTISGALASELGNRFSPPEVGALISGGQVSVVEGPWLLECFESTASEWAEQDPDAAYAWASGLEGGAREAALGAALSTWAETDPDRVASAVSAMGVADHEAAAVGLRRVARADRALAMETIDSMPEAMRAEARRRVARDWFDADPDGAAAYVVGLPVDAAGRRSLVSSMVAHRYGNEEPAELAAWVEGLAGDPAEAGASAMLVAKWVRRDAGAASEWVAGLPRGEAREAASGELAEWLIERDAAAAYEWADEVGDVEHREKLRESAMELWRQVDPEAAAADLR